MISPTDTDIALTVLRQYDLQTQSILDTCNNVQLYNYDKVSNSWVIKNESDGAFYLVKRYIPPIYKFVILSKYNKPGSTLSTTEIPLSPYLIFQTYDTFYMFKNESGIIQAILFPNKPDCDRICIKVEKVLKELKQEFEKPTPVTPLNNKPKFVENIEEILSNKVATEVTINGKEKFLNMLESARQRYEDVHVEKWTRQIDIKELFKSTTTTNQDIGTSVMVNAISSYNQIPPIRQIHPKVMDCQTNQNRPNRIAVQNPLAVTDQLSRPKNGPNTITVTELEKYLVQNASSSVSKSDTIIDDDDDSLLLGPNKFEKQDFPLNKEQLKDALIYLLQNDTDGGFLSSIHTAYTESHKRASTRK